MTYNAEIAELRRKIDMLDYEIFDKIVELSQAIKCLKQKTDSDVGYVPLIISDVEKLALQNDLDVQAVVEIFRKIMWLIDDQVVTPN